MTGKAVLHAQAAHEATVPALVAVGVEIDVTLDVVGSTHETIVVNAAIVARQPVAAIDTQVAEATQLLTTEAERRHDRQLQVVVNVFVIHRDAVTQNTMVLLCPVEIGTDTQPLREVILTGDTHRETPAVIDVVVRHVLSVHAVVIGASTNGSPYPPLGMSHCRQHQEHRSQ